MIKNLKGYVEHIRGHAYYWKYRPVVYYYTRLFKFANIGTSAGGNATLTIHGITPEFKRQTITVSDYETYRNMDAHMNETWPKFVTDAYNQAKQNNDTEFQVGWDIPSRKYRIYYEIRNSNLDRWEVVIPKVDTGWDLIADEFNRLGTSNYDLTDKFISGLTYDPSYGHPQLPGHDGRVPYEVWGLPPAFWTARSVTSGDETIIYNDLNGDSKVNSGYRYLFKTNGGGHHYIPTDLSRILNRELPGILAETGEHPAYAFYNDTEDSNRTKFYDWLPIGINRYSVTLKLANGESISSEFDL